MSNLVLELRQGDMMIVNGASIRFRSKTRIELAAKARFLFGKQIMPPDSADSPARRIYFALQTAYIGTDDERIGGLAEARHLIGRGDNSVADHAHVDVLAQHAGEIGNARDHRSQSQRRCAFCPKSV